MKVYLEPDFADPEDQPHGGIRRVIDAMREHLPAHHVEFVWNIEEADLVNIHVTALKQTERYLNSHPDVPLIVSSHGLYWAEYDWPFRWHYNANVACLGLIRMADTVTAPSEWVSQSIRRNSLRPVVTIGHGVDLVDWPVGTSEGYVLWNKTRADPVCDPMDMIQLAQLAPEIPFLSTFTLKGGLANVTQTKPVPYDESKSMVQKAGVYLCTARETFGIGTIEAMAAGVPILGWNFGGQADIVDHKETGWLATPGDFEDLREGLDYCLANRERLGRAARKIVEEKYQWKHVVSNYAELYRETLSRFREERPRVSIVVPAYGLEDHLEETLDSVVAQTVGDWECVVVDDASPDRCGEIADEYAAADNRFSVIHNTENQYLAGALNTGIDAARGRYILPLDADNLLPLNTVRELAGGLDRDRRVSIAYGSVEFMEPDGRRWHSGWPPAFKAEDQIMGRAGDRPMNLVPSTAMYRKEVWELTGGYRKRHKTAEDADFWTRATSYGFPAKMVTDQDTLVYRNRADSMSRQETLRDWTLWYPWCREHAAPPAIIDFEGRVAVPSFDPPLVSVVIPVGPGHEELLVDALDSVDAQTFRMWQCVVINDTGQALKRLPSWVKLFETEGRTGVAHARNIGIEGSSAKLFVPLDADDTLEPEALARLHSSYREHGGYIYPDWHERWVGEPIKVWSNPDYDPRALLRKGCLHSVTALYPKAAWEEVGGFDEDLPAWEDWDFQLRLANIAVCGTRYPMPLFTYRKDTGFRREENYADFESSKAAILERWKDYFDGRKELMACGGCRKGGRSSAPASAPSMQAGIVQSSASADFVTVEYFGAKMAGRSFKAPSGQNYRFSGRESERRKLVRKGDDVDFLLGFADFRVLEAVNV